MIFIPLSSHPLPLFHSVTHARYRPRSGTGATQSYWHREAILACVSRLATLVLSWFSYLCPLTPYLCSTRLPTLPPAKRNWRDAVVLASRSDTGLRKQTGDARSYRLLPTTYNAQPTRVLQPVMGVSFYKSSITASRFNSLHSAGFFVFYLEHQVKIKGLSFP